MLDYFSLRENAHEYMYTYIQYMVLLTTAKTTIQSANFYVFR